MSTIHQPSGAGTDRQATAPTHHGVVGDHLLTPRFYRHASERTPTGRYERVARPLKATQAAGGGGIVNGPRPPLRRSVMLRRRVFSGLYGA